MCFCPSEILFVFWRYTKGCFSLCSFAFLVAVGDTAAANHFLMQSHGASSVQDVIGCWYSNSVCLELTSEQKRQNRKGSCMCMQHYTHPLVYTGQCLPCSTTSFPLCDVVKSTKKLAGSKKSQNAEHCRN